MTLTEKAVCEAHTGVTFCVGKESSAVCKYAEHLMGRPVDPCELESEYILLRLRTLSRYDFIKICRDIPLGFTINLEEKENDAY